MTIDASSNEPKHKHPSLVEQEAGGIAAVDIRLLRIFCVVVASGGLSAATTELQADLSTVSRYIKELEDLLGERLCNRGRSGFSLTPQGMVVHSAAQDLFRALKAFQDNINGHQADPVGELRLGVMDALVTDPQLTLPGALRAFRARAPRVRMHLAVSKPNDIERQVLLGELDAGIVAARTHPPGLDCVSLYQETSSLYCSQHHPLYEQDDAAIRLEGVAPMDLVEDPYTESLPLRGYAGVLRSAASATSIEAVALLVASGDYVGFLPDHYAASLAPVMALRRIRPDVFHYAQGIELVWRSGVRNALVQGLSAELVPRRA